LLALLFGVTTLLFFALRATGDPIVVLAGSDASPEQIELIRAEYGFDKPLIVQYARYLANVAQLEFGVSLATGQPAFAMVLERLPATLLLAVLGLGATILLAVPLGAWLGFRPRAAARRCVAGLVYIFQGIPGFVVALILIHVFVVQLMWLPSLGYRDIVNWILPAIALASFLAPKLIRVIAANVTETMREDYIQTAKAAGAPESEVLLKYALPNALLGAAALIGAQFALLISGAVIIEVLFLWPGIGLLLLKSTLTLDFPVVQAFAFVVAVLIFVVNSLVDLLFRRLDPRLEGAP
jgi:peptide/nickel transport system permease protein